MGLNLLEVEFEFLAFEDVTVAATRLTGARSNDGVETTSGELVINSGLDLGEGLAAGLLLQDTVGTLFGFSSSIGGALLTQNFTVVRFVPLTEGSSIDLNNGVLDEGLGTDKLVVGGIVDNVNDTGLAGNGFTSPAEGTGIQPESTEFGVTSTDTDSVNTLLA